MSRLTNSLLVLALLVFCGLMLNLSLPYFTFRYDVDFLLTKQGIIHIKTWRYAFYAHVFLSILSLIAGLTQFSSYILKQYKYVHRAMGYVYIVDVLFIAGPAGLIMSFFANGNYASKVSFVFLSILWIVFTAIALLKVKQKKFDKHRNWMMRSYALTLSAISLRLYAWLFPKFIHLNAFDEYALIAWLSWTLNLLIAEYLIFRKGKTELLIF